MHFTRTGAFLIAGNFAVGLAAYPQTTPIATQVYTHCSPSPSGDPDGTVIEVDFEVVAAATQGPVPSANGRVKIEFNYRGYTAYACEANLGVDPGFGSCVWHATEGPGEYILTATYSGSPGYSSSTEQEIECIIDA